MFLQLQFQCNSILFLEIKRKGLLIHHKKFGEVDLVAYALSLADNIESNEEPSTYEEVVSCSDSSKLIIDMQEEMESFHKNGTWDMVRLHKGKKSIRCKWVFKKKEGTPRVENARYKVRLVAKGYN